MTSQRQRQEDLCFVLRYIADYTSYTPGIQDNGVFDKPSTCDAVTVSKPSGARAFPLRMSALLPSLPFGEAFSHFAAPAHMPWVYGCAHGDVLALCALPEADVNVYPVPYIQHPLATACQLDDSKPCVMDPCVIDHIERAYCPAMKSKLAGLFGGPCHSTDVMMMSIRWGCGVRCVCDATWAQARVTGRL